MRVLHIANKNYSSWSLRPWLLLKVLEIPFEERLHVFGEGAFDFSPTQKVPLLVDGETAVWDSLAIAEYLAEDFPNVWPEDRATRAWARSACAEMHSGFSQLREVCSMNCGVRVALANPNDPALHADLARIAALWEDGLSRFDGPFLAGSAFTAVDAFFAPIPFRLQTYGLSLPPTAQAWADRMLALPAMQDWYEAGLAETFRDLAHDANAAQHGRITQDLRATA